MVKPFQFARLPEIIFSNGSLSGLPAIIKKVGYPFILVTGKSSFLKSRQGERLIESLKRNKITFYIVSIPGEPTPEMVDSAVQENRDRNIKLVVSIGGGSVVDAGKAISAMMKTNGSVKDYLEGVGHIESPGTKLPFIAIPTTSGTGSEATKNAVLAEVGPGGFKKSLRHDNYIPDIALLDPELTLNCPQNITAASGMDCFTQLLEAFLSNNASDYTDSFARLGLRAIKESLILSVREGDSLDARTGMSFAAINSGICLANAGLGTVHGFASEIGGRFDIPHGLVCGTLMAAANRVTVSELRKHGSSPALEKYVEMGKLFLDQAGKGDDYYIDGFIDYLYQLTDELELARLGNYGLSGTYIKSICETTGNKNNPVKLNLEQRIKILSERI